MTALRDQLLGLTIKCRQRRVATKLGTANHALAPFSSLLSHLYVTLESRAWYYFLPSPSTFAFAFVAVSLLALGATGDSSVHARRAIYYETHGRDDLREWRAALLKEVQYIKIDFYF